MKSTIRKILFLDLLFFVHPVQAMHVATQTDDYLNNRQLVEIVTPASPVTPVLSVVTGAPESPDTHLSIEMAITNCGCFKCRCKAKFKRMAQAGGAGVVGTVAGAIIAILLL